MADPFQPPAAGIDPPQPVGRPRPRRAWWVTGAAVLCFVIGGLLGSDLVTFLFTKGARVLDALAGRRPFRAYERTLIVEAVANLVIGSLATLAGGCFWANRRLAAWLMILLGLLALVATAWGMAGI